MPVYNTDTGAGPGGVDGEVNVQADWNESTSSSDAYIKNKPTIPDISGKQDTIDSGNKDAVKTALGLNNVDNTSDSGKPVSTAQQTAIDAKINTADIKDGLTHTDTDKPGSAKNDKDLKDLIDGKSDQISSPTNGDVVTTDGSGTLVSSGPQLPI